MWRRLGFEDFEHFVLWCPGCFGILVGGFGVGIIMGVAWWLFG